MPDLIVDGTLDETSNALKALRTEFETASRRADETAGIWGQRDVSGAMEEFADNWRVHRDEILDRLSKLSDRVAQATTVWSDAEKELSKALETSGEQNA